MIKVIIKGKKAKTKASGEEFMTVREIAFGMACCINEMSYGKADFERIKADVIRELTKITLTEDGKAFDFGIENEE
ncbi:MAG: hypothetical protein IJC09_06220 [Clostridia bacterium]|nr:hypothetical protein [Clostridia bacterium]